MAQGPEASTFLPYYFLTDHLGSVRVVVAESHDGDQVLRTTLERNDYYPFGSRWEDPESLLSDNRYRYNGKEEQAFVGLPYIDCGARQLLASFHIWLTQDPLAEKYYAVSPYAFCAGNPIKYIDLWGTKFSDALKKEVNRLRQRISEMTEYNNQRIERLRAQQKEEGATERKIVRLNRKIEHWSNTNAQLAEVTKELDVLENSSQEYDYKIQERTPNTGETTYIGTSVVIQMCPNSSFDLLAHELKHAYQFETGELSFHLGKKKYFEEVNLFYDIYDEMEAYKRGELFKGPTFFSIISEQPDLYRNLPTKILNATTVPYIHGKQNDPVFLNRYAINNHQVFRVNGVTYPFNQ